MSANQARAAVAALSLLALASCKGGESGNLTGPTTGDVRVTVQTSGPDADADGYVVALTGGASQSVAPNGSVLFENMSPGGSTVTISGVAANCTASGGTSVQVTVVAGSTATATFTVTCEALTGSLEVTTVTTGAISRRGVAY